MNTPAPSDDDLPALDADVLHELAAHHAAERVPPAVAARLKHRLLDRIARAESGHKTLQSSDEPWQPFKDGVDIKVLHEADGVMSYLLRLAPGGVVDAHRHPIDEECVVLEGTVRVGDALELRAGGFHLAAKGTLHAPILSECGATLFLRGASPHMADLV